MARLRSMAVGLLLTTWCVLALISCAKSEESITAADGLSLYAVAAQFERSTSGEHFQQLLNTSGVNNLHLDESPHVNIINVHEYGDDQNRVRAFSLSTTLENDSVQQIAEVRFQDGMNGVTWEICGNVEIYGHGPGRCIRSARPIRTSHLLLAAWLFAPHPVYVTHYSRAYLPVGYVPVVVVPVTIYRTVTKPVIQTTTSQIQQIDKPTIVTKVVSPNEGRSSAAIIAPLRQPTQTQKQFQERPEVKEIQQAKGFVKKDPATAATQPKVVAPDVQPRASQPVHGANAPAVVISNKEKITTDKQLKMRDENKDVPKASGFGLKDKEPVVKKEQPIVQKKAK